MITIWVQRLYEETDADSIFALYDFFETIVEAHLGSINKVDVKIVKHENALALRMELSSASADFHPIFPDSPKLSVKVLQKNAFFECIASVSRGGNQK